MRVDVQALVTLNRLARDGAREAAGCLSGLSGVETGVEAVKITFVPATDVRQLNDAVGVEVGLSGALSGQTVLAFDRESIRTLGEYVTGEPTVEESVVREVGNVVTAGFVDGWAQSVDETIDVTPPTFVDGPVETLGDEHVVGFTVRIETVDGNVAVQFFLIPERESLIGALEEYDVDAETAVEKLVGFAELAHNGAATASDSLSSMTDIETTVEITELNFVPVEQATQSISDGPAVGVVTEFSGPPGGFLVILFSEASARRLAESLVPEADQPFAGLGESAIREIGNVTATSFLDGWANVLETTIDISPPQFVHDLGGAIVDPIIAHLGVDQQYAFACDAVVEADDEGFDCGIYTFPDEGELATALAALDVDRVTDGSAERI